MPEKPCSVCKGLKPADREFFGPHKKGRYGLSPSCRDCEKARAALRRQKPDQKERLARWNAENAERVRELSRLKAKAYRLRDPEVKKARANVYTKNKYRVDPAYNLRVRTSARLNSLLRNKGGEASEKILGYSFSELKEHLERQFSEGMTWEKFLRGEIHVDHKIPVVHFNPVEIDTPAFRECWALENLQPLWAFDNLSKGAKIL